MDWQPGLHRGKNNGTQTEYEEGDEIDQTKLNGGGPYASPIDGGVLSLDPAEIRARSVLQAAACAPVYPWNFIRTNTIFGVIHAAGGYTAWSDKHAVYAAVSGPTGTSTPSNINDYYSPEVNSNQVPVAVECRHRRDELPLREHRGKHKRLDHRFSGHPVL